jgi:glutamate dehydrogenase/leucine dehydrogenase
MKDEMAKLGLPTGIEGKRVVVQGLGNVDTIPQNFSGSWGKVVDWQNSGLNAERS